MEGLSGAWVNPLSCGTNEIILPQFWKISASIMIAVMSLALVT